MSERIEYIEKDNELQITIKALIDDKKQQMLLIWIVLFTICGVLLISQFFGDYENSIKLFFAVYMAFWLFFEFKVIYAFRWRKYGQEIVKINSDQLTLIKEIGKRGLTQQFDLDKIGKIQKFNSEDNAFFKSMNTSYWNINKYTLSFNSDKTPVPFAIDLDEKESKKLLNKIQQFIKNRTN